MTLDPEIVRELGLELDVEAQQMAARVLRLAKIHEHALGREKQPPRLVNSDTGFHGEEGG